MICTLHKHTPHLLQSGEKKDEKWGEAPFKRLIILRAASPCEYTLYLLTISPSLFRGPRLIAPFNLHVCEMRGLECRALTAARLRLISAAPGPLDGKLINEKVEISSMRTVFCF